MTTRTIVAGSSGQGREEEEQEASAGGPEEEAQGGAGRRTCLMESSLFYWLPFEQSWPSATPPAFPWLAAGAGALRSGSVVRAGLGRVLPGLTARQTHVRGQSSAKQTREGGSAPAPIEVHRPRLLTQRVFVIRAPDVPRTSARVAPRSDHPSTPAPHPCVPAMTSAIARTECYTPSTVHIPATRARRPPRPRPLQKSQQQVRWPS